MKNCIFCKVIKKELPSKIEFEDENFIAIHDIYPKAKFHILLIPKKHIESISDLKNEDAVLMGEIMLLAKKIAEENGLNGYRIVTNTGKDSGQTVNHIHFHLLGGQKLDNFC